jgi:hypothetical protein
MGLSGIGAGGGGTKVGSGDEGREFSGDEDGLEEAEEEAEEEEEEEGEGEGGKERGSEGMDSVPGAA